MKIAVGSKNSAKLKAARTVVNKIFPRDKIKVIAVEVDSGVSKQPKSDDEAIKGAINRAKKPLKYLAPTTQSAWKAECIK